MSHRAMPGPPQLTRADALGDWDSDGRWCNRWDLHWEGGRDEFDVLERHDKRLTDAECAAEFWRAKSSYWTSRAMERNPNRAAFELSAFDRFATRPHALEES